MHVITLKDRLAESSSLVGGKGSSLATIASLDVRSLNGFCISADNYINILNTSGINRSLSTLLNDKRILSDDELISIRDMFFSANIEPTLQRAIEYQYAVLEEQAAIYPFRVAVRSSATLEDSLRLSFAGQHDTFLNVSGIDCIIECMKKCWASYWSKRSYHYRRQKGINHFDGAMAVVVQEFLPADASGVLFTINPVTNNCKETLIESCWGLGELIVSGRVTPDSYLVDNSTVPPVITRKTIKTKKRMITPNHSNGNGTCIIETSQDLAEMQVIDDYMIIELASIGNMLSKHFGNAQDIEWASYKNNIYILQSRPITTN